MPQARAWEHMHLERVVARYAAKLVEAEKPNAKAPLLSEVRQLEDRLGLNAAALLRLRWQIIDPEPEADKSDRARVSKLDDYRDILG